MKEPRMVIPLGIAILLVSGFIFQQANAYPGDTKRFQLSLDGGPIDYPKYSGAISFAFRTSERWYWGVRVGYAWEDNLNTYDDIEIWDEMHVDIFRRFRSSDSLYIDFGVTYFAHSPEDDTNKTGSFIGAYSSISLGYKFIFVAPVVRIGYSDLEGFGAIFSPFIVKIQIQF